VHVVVPFDTPVVPARLVGEGQLLDLAVLDKQMQGAIDGAVGDGWVPAAHALEDLAGGQVAISRLDLRQDHRSLRCISVRHHLRPALLPCIRIRRGTYPQ